MRVNAINDVDTWAKPTADYNRVKIPIGPHAFTATADEATEFAYQLTRAADALKSASASVSPREGAHLPPENS